MDIEAKVYSRRDFVDMLPSGTLRADGRDLNLVGVYGDGHDVIVVAMVSLEATWRPRGDGDAGLTA